MRMPLAVVAAILVAGTSVLAGCSYDQDDGTGRLQILLKIPGNLRAWGFEHVQVTVVNISAETTANVKHEWKPTNRNLDLSDDSMVLDAQVEEGEYDNFDLYVTNMRGVFANETEVVIKTEPFVGRHRVHQEVGQEVLVIEGQSIRFEITSELVKDTSGDFVWK